MTSALILIAALISVAVIPALIIPLNRLRTGCELRPDWSRSDFFIAVDDCPEVDCYPTSLVLLVLLSEDPRFFQHRGFQPEEMLRRLTLFRYRRDRLYGGSSITQQVVKNLYLSFRRSPVRKLREFILAARLERRFSKTEILRLYFHTIRLSENCAGFSAASQHYFSHSVETLAVPEAVFLAGIISRPTDADRFLSGRTPGEDPFPYQRMFQNVCSLLRFAVKTWGAPAVDGVLDAPFGSVRDEISRLDLRASPLSLVSEHALRKRAAATISEVRALVGRHQIRNDSDSHILDRGAASS